MKRLEGKTALITGGARGIGLEIASLFAAEGARVAVADLSGAEAQAAAAGIAAKTGTAAIGLGMDVSKEADCGNAVDETIKAFGKLDILVNNAGITRDNLVLRMKETDFDAVMAVNLKGAFLMSKAAAKLMLKAAPGIFCAGERLDWEAPTGGYLLSACFASGHAAGKGVLEWFSPPAEDARQ